MLKFFKSLFLLGVIFFASTSIALAADANLTIRNGDTIIFSGAVVFPTGITTTEDSEGNPHELDPNSVLSVVLSADAASEDFEVSEITYFSSFGSLYLKCIDSLCDNWQYVVNGESPSLGIDKKTLSGGETVYLYFGPTSKISLGASNITKDENLPVTALKYDYENNAWVARPGIIVGLTQPNPDDPFSPLEIMTMGVDTDGRAVFSNIPAGTYDVGIKEDFYFPTKQLTVNVPAPDSSGGGGSGSSSRRSPGEVLGVETKVEFSVPRALEFLATQQKEDGSFGAPMYTDWVALALAYGNNQNITTKLVKYLSTEKLETPLLTDYERRAIALMALGLNPYNTNGINYIAEIAKSFDGTQFGDPNEGNDDIFALIVLRNAGFGVEESMIQKSTDFILSLQKENGSWYESVDMTGVAVVALAPQKENEKVAAALAKAKEFLKETQGSRLDGSWDASASSTAWAIEGLKALGEDLKDWERDDETPINFLGTLQDRDGGIKGEDLNNRIWETAYAISAVSGKTWNEVMQKFEKQEIKPEQKVKKAAAPKKLDLTQDIPFAEETPEPPKSWFKKLLKNIFGF